MTKHTARHTARGTPSIRPSFHARAPGWPRSAVAGVCLTVLLALGATRGVLGDTVELLDGSSVKGKVWDLGGCHIAVEFQNGRRMLLKKDIKSVEFTTGDASRIKRSDRDVILRRTGEDLYGKAKYSENGQSIIVDGGLHMQ